MSHPNELSQCNSLENITTSDSSVKFNSVLIGNSFEQSATCAEVLNTCPDISRNNYSVPNIMVDDCPSNCIADSKFPDMKVILEESELKEFEGLERRFKHNSVLVGNSFEQSVTCVEVSNTCTDMSSNNCSVPDVMVDEYPSNCISDIDLKIMHEESELKEFERLERSFSQNSGVISLDFTDGEYVSPLKDDEFHDAYNFFNDPEALNILENAGSSASSKSLVERSSLYQKFDPLYANFTSKSNEIQEAIKDKITFIEDKLRMNSSCEDQIANPREFLEDMLLSFDSPMENIYSFLENKDEKVYTEKDLQNALKVKEFEMLGSFLEKEKEFFKKHEDIITEHRELGKNLKGFAEDLENIKNTISDSEKEFEKNKAILNLSIENILKQLEQFIVRLDEKQKMYRDLQCRSENLLDKTTRKFTIEKDFCDAQSPE